MLPDNIWHLGRCVVLLEGAHLTPEQRVSLSERLFLPLFLHDDMFELINPGPWIRDALPQDEPLLCELIQQGHVVGLLESEKSLNALQQQLALAARVIEPGGKYSQLLRFYTPHALPLLLAQHTTPWHGGVFGGISRWWLRERDESWRELKLSIPEAEPEPVKLTPALYQALEGSQMERRLMSLWREGDSIGHFPVCERDAMVRKALSKAEKAGATEEQLLLWALVWLEGGTPALEEIKSKA